MSTGLFDGLGKSSITERGKYMAGDFNGIVQLKRVITKNTRNKGPAFIADLTIVTSNLDDPRFAANQDFNWYQKMVDKDIAFPAIKEFFVAFAGVDPKDEVEVAKLSDTMDSAIAECVQSPDDNMLVGSLVHLRTEEIKTEEGKPFTRHYWRPVTDELLESMGIEVPEEVPSF